MTHSRYAGETQTAYGYKRPVRLMGNRRHQERPPAGGPTAPGDPGRPRTTSPGRRMRFTAAVHTVAIMRGSSTGLLKSAGPRWFSSSAARGSYGTPRHSVGTPSAFLSN
jgi:hypothetical protein